MALKYFTVLFLCRLAFAGALKTFEKTPPKVDQFFPLVDGEIAEILGYSRGIIRRLIESYLFDSDDDSDATNKQRESDTKDLMEQMRYLHCVHRPCLYGGHCKLYEFGERFVEAEFEANMGLFDRDAFGMPRSQKDAGDGWVAGMPMPNAYNEQRVAMLRAVEEYLYRLEKAPEGKNVFLINHSEGIVWCACRFGISFDGRCHGCPRIFENPE